MPTNRRPMTSSFFLPFSRTGSITLLLLLQALHILLFSPARSGAFSTTTPLFRTSTILERVPYQDKPRQRQQQTTSISAAVKIWVEEAEDGFVDEEENLEEGEVCIRAVKAFASTASHDQEYEGKRFLCAGALVQRPAASNDKRSLQLYDVWMADSILEEGGPNLQIQGAVQILDDLFLHHLQRHANNNNNNHNISSADMVVSALRSFVVQCDADSDFTCASYQAMLDRGFRPLPKILEGEDDNTTAIYRVEDYVDNDDDESDMASSGHLRDYPPGNLFHYKHGKRRYAQLAAAHSDGDGDDTTPTQNIALAILAMLPDQRTMER